MNKRHKEKAIKAAKKALERNKKLINATYRGTPKNSNYSKYN